MQIETIKIERGENKIDVPKGFKIQKAIMTGYGEVFIIANGYNTKETEKRSIYLIGCEETSSQNMRIEWECIDSVKLHQNMGIEWEYIDSVCEGTSILHIVELK